MLSLALSASARTHSRGCCKRTSTPGGVRAVTLPWSMPCHVFSYTGLSPRRASIVIEFMQRQLQVYDDANDNETGCVNPTFFYFARYGDLLRR